MLKYWFSLAFTVLAGLAYAQDIVCAKTYPHHLQGVATDGESIYWSFSDYLVKTDKNGTVLAETEIVMHSGDLCVTGGKVYVATEEGLYVRADGFKQEVRVYDAETLGLERIVSVPEVVNGASAMTFANGRFYIASGMPESLEGTAAENEVFEYTADFQPVKVHRLATGYTEFGIQTIHYARDRFYLGFYGSTAVPTGTFAASSDFSVFRRYDGDTSVGILELDGRLYRGQTVKQDDARYSGSLTEYPDPAADLLASASPVPGVGTVAVSPALAELGFLPSSYLLTGGIREGLFSGGYNVQVNDKSKGGGVVTLANGLNSFAGGIHVASGTLAVPSTRAMERMPSCLGAGTLPIVVGPGTLHFTGDVQTDRDLIFLPADDNARAPAIVRVDNGVRALVRARVSTADGKSGNFMKTGPGTLVVATPWSGSENKLGVRGSQPGWVGVNTAPPSFAANGDAPTAGFEVFNLIDGRLEIATAPDVVTRFPSETWIGISSTSAADAETSGHLDIKSGTVVFDALTLGRHNGTTTTAPDGLASSLDVYGGAVSVKSLNIGYGDDPKFTHRPELNVHGGSLRIEGNVRLDHNWSYGKITVDGGEMTVDGYVHNQHYLRNNNADITGGSQLYLDVSGEGRFTCNGSFCAAYHSSPARRTVCRVTVKDGGTFAAKNVTGHAEGDTSMLVDGGTFKAISTGYSDCVDFSEVLVGEKGMTIDVSSGSSWGARWLAPIRPAPGVTDGGIDIVGRYGGVDLRWFSSRLRLETDDISVSGGIRVKNAGIAFGGGHFTPPFTMSGSSMIHVYGDTTIDSLECRGKTLQLNLGYTGTGAGVAELPRLAVGELVPPAGGVTVTLFNGDGTTMTRYAGTYDIFECPSTVDFGAKEFRMMDNHADYVFLFSEREEDGVRIVSLTVGTGGSGTFTGEDPRESDAWRTGTGAWSIGSWVFGYGGETLTSYAPLTLAVARDRSAGISVPEDVTLTLAGGLSAAAGGFVKTGDGTLAFAGDKGYSFAPSFKSTAPLGSSLENLALFDGLTNGAPSVATHDASLTVGRGTLTIGTGSDSPVVTVPVGELVIGTATTEEPLGEGDAGLVLNSGHLAVDGTMIVGYNHGTPDTRAKDTLVSSYVQNGGTADVLRVKVGLDITKAARMDARFTLNGGLLNCRRYFYLGQQTTSSTLPMTVSFMQTGGTLLVGGDVFETHRAGTASSTTEDGRLITAYSAASGLTAVYTMSAGEARFYRGCSFWNGGTKTMNLDGGTIHFWNTFNGGDNTTLNWNGTVIVPHDDDSGNRPTFLRFFTAIKTDTEAVIDATYSREIDMYQVPSGTGRLVVRGTSTNNVVRLPATTWSLGGVTVEEGGVVIPLGNAGASTAPADILVKDGGGICDYYGNTIPSLTLGETDADTVVLYGYDMRRGLDWLKVNELTVNAGTVYIAYRDPLAVELSAYGGRRAFLTGPKGSIDPAKFVIHPKLAARGAEAVFELDTSDSAKDVLYAVITAPASEWTGAGSGEWSDEGSWDTPPAGTLHDAIVFPETLDTDVAVSVGSGTHVRTIDQNAAKTVTLAGDLVFDGCAEYNITDPDGVLEISGLLASGSADWNSKTLISRGTSGRGTLRISGALDNGLRLESRSGRIEGLPEAFQDATVTLNNTTLRFTGSGVCRASVNGTGNGAGFEVVDGEIVYQTGAMNIETPFVKTGGGTLVVRRPGTTVLGKYSKNKDAFPYANGTNGDVHNSGGFSLYAGKLVLDGAGGGTFDLGGVVYFDVGLYPVADGTGGAYPAVLEVTGGAEVVSPVAFYIGHYGYKKGDNPVSLGLTRRPYYALDVRDGRVTVPSLFLNYNNYGAKGCMRAELNVYEGGEFVTTSGRFAVCHDGDDVELEEGPSVGVVNLYGGLIDHMHTEDVKVNYYSSHCVYPARGIINIHGGLFRTKAGYGIDLMRGHGHGSLNLYGGVLETGFIRNVPGNAAKSKGDVHFDGGTYRPLASGWEMKGWTTFTVGPGGATVDLSKADTLTFSQTLTATNGTTGGITLESGGNAKALLTLKAANAFGGPLTVNGGRMLAEIPTAASCAAGVTVNAGGVFDANTYNLTFGFLGGEGGCYSNGTVTVTGAVAPSNTTFTVENLVLGEGARLFCPVTGDAENGWTAPYLTVTESIVKEGAAFLDLGRAAGSPLPVGASVKIAEAAPGVVFPQLGKVNAGSAADSSVAIRRRTLASGVTEVWATVVASPTVLLIR